MTSARPCSGSTDALRRIHMADGVGGDAPPADRDRAMVEALRAGADPRETFDGLRCALHVVSDPEAAAAMHALGVPLDARDMDGEQPLHAACRRGSPALVARLLALGAPTGCHDDRGRLPIHRCWDNPDAAGVIRAFIGAGADIDAPALDGVRAVSIVRDPEALRALLAAGASVGAANLHGRQPLHIHATSREPGAADCVRILVDAGADVRHRDVHGGTPLHNAATGAAVRILVAAGADVAALDRHGATPLDNLLVSCGPDAITALLDAGAPWFPPSRDMRDAPALADAAAASPDHKAAWLKASWDVLDGIPVAGRPPPEIIDWIGAGIAASPPDRVLPLLAWLSDHGRPS